MLPPGSALPSERELAERYGVARMTVRGELDRLTADGLTYRIQGRGTFVSEPRVSQAMALTSFTEDMRARGLEPSSRLLARSRTTAGGRDGAAAAGGPGRAAGAGGPAAAGRRDAAGGGAGDAAAGALPRGRDRGPGRRRRCSSCSSSAGARARPTPTSACWPWRIAGARRRLLDVPAGHPGLRFEIAGPRRRRPARCTSPCRCSGATATRSSCARSARPGAP